MRYNVYNSSIDNFGELSYDIFSINWADFKWKRGFTEHIVTKTEALKPYLISFRFYNTYDYDDIIFILNKLPDIDLLRPGMIIYIPRLQDIKDFILEQGEL